MVCHHVRYKIIQFPGKLYNRCRALKWTAADTDSKHTCICGYAHSTLSLHGHIQHVLNQNPNGSCSVYRQFDRHMERAVRPVQSKPWTLKILNMICIKHPVILSDLGGSVYRMCQKLNILCITLFSWVYNCFRIRIVLFFVFCFLL